MWWTSLSDSKRRKKQKVSLNNTINKINHINYLFLKRLYQDFEFWWRWHCLLHFPKPGSAFPVCLQMLAAVPLPSSALHQHLPLQPPLLHCCSHYYLATVSMSGILLTEYYYIMSRNYLKRLLEVWVWGVFTKTSCCCCCCKNQQFKIQRHDIKHVKFALMEPATFWQLLSERFL